MRNKISFAIVSLIILVKIILIMMTKTQYDESNNNLIQLETQIDEYTKHTRDVLDEANGRIVVLGSCHTVIPNLSRWLQSFDNAPVNNAKFTQSD